MPPILLGRLPATEWSRLRTFVFILIAVTSSTAATATEPSTEQLEWLVLVDSIITETERQAFADLERNYQREAFIARFWYERDPRPETPQNEFQETWRQRAALVGEQFDTLEGDRSRTMLLIGFPNTMLPELCPELLRPAEAWFYGADSEHPEGFYLVFYRPDDESEAPLTHWDPGEGYAALVRAPTAADPNTLPTTVSRRCTRGREVEAALTRAVGWDDLRRDSPLLPPTPDPWVDEFLDRTTDLDPETPAIVASMQLRFPGHLQEKSVAQIEIVIPSEVAAPSDSDTGLFRLRVDGEILRRETLFDKFRYEFEVPVEDVVDREIPLAFQRELLPGLYTLILRLEDLNSGHAFRSEGDLQVPHPAETAAGPDPGFSEANAVLDAGDHRVKIRPLPEELLTGRARVEAEVLGDSVAKVTFVLNGRTVMSKTRAPYSLEIDLGHAPRLHWLEAIAIDHTGQELARDRIPVNAGPHRFAVRLVEPRQGERYINSLRAAAEIHLPAGERLDRVDFYLNENRLATLYQPPFVQPLLLPQSERITYIRAVAYLDDGNATEDLVFINAPQDMASLRINMVELFTTVNDKKGKPVEGLSSDEFRIREEGEEQQIRRFERVEDLSIHAGIIIDASTSMREELEEAIDGALQFFEAVIRPKDRATVVVFNDEPILKVPFTNSLDVLAKSLEDVESEGETTLYDTMVFSLHYFAGIRGKRALILISDGEDSSSRYSFAETLEFAQRSGVAIYTVGLGVDPRQLEARRVLQRLAGETGGRFFSIASVRELEEIYSTIEKELRSQYLLAYQSTHEVGGDFRRVDVEVAREGLKAKTIPGYYP